MSSVSLDSGLQNYYHKTLKELQDENESETKRTRKLNEAQTEELEKDYKTALLRKDREADKTIQNTRKEANELLEDQKQKYNRSLDDMEDKLRVSKEAHAPGNETGLGNYTLKSIDEIRNQAKEEANRTQEAQQRRENQMISGHELELTKRQRETDEAVRSAKASANEIVLRERTQSQADVDRIKNQTYNARGQIPGSVAPEVYKKEINDLVESADIRHKRDIEGTEIVRGDAAHDLGELDRSQQSRIQKLTVKQGEQVADFENQIRDLDTYNRESAKHQAATARATVEDIEKKFRGERQQITDSFGAASDKLASDNQDKDSYYGRRTAETIREKENYLAKQISKQNNDNFQKQNQLENIFENQVKQVEKARKEDQRRATEVNEKTIERADEARNKALEFQAGSNSETLNRVRKGGETQISALEKELQKQKTSKDTALVPPAAEAEIRNTITMGYEKKLNTEIDKNKTTAEHIQRKYADQYQKVIEDSNEKMTLQNQQVSAENTFDRKRFLDSMNELEDRTDTKLRDKQYDHNRENENLFRQFGNLMERQRKDYDHILQNSRDDSENRLSGFRQEAEINSKTAYRAFNGKQNELIRDYEKKLGDQKAESDFKIEDLKTQSQTDLRDMERHNKQELELQSKGYEQRIAQLETQGKERERYISQLYQDELERTKRSYELLSKKKS